MQTFQLCKISLTSSYGRSGQVVGVGILPVGERECRLKTPNDVLSVGHDRSPSEGADLLHMPSGALKVPLEY